MLFNREKIEASVLVFYADWTSVPVPRTSSLRGLDVGFIPLLPKELPYMANQHGLFPPIYNKYKLHILLRFTIIINCRTKNCTTTIRHH